MKNESELLKLKICVNPSGISGNGLCGNGLSGNGLNGNGLMGNGGNGFDNCECDFSFESEFNQFKSLIK